MSKQTPVAVDGVDYRYQFLFQTNFDKFPDFNPRHFAVLALVDGGYSQNEIIKVLDGQIHRTTIFAILAEACEMGLAKFKVKDEGKVGGDREWQITFQGTRFLDAYVTLMSFMMSK